MSRNILRCLSIVGAFLLLVVPGGARSQSHEVSPMQPLSQAGKEHYLRLHNTHTGERIDIVYRCGHPFRLI